MAQDNRILGFVTPADLVALMRETGHISVQESAVSDGKPVIHAALKVINANTGEQLPGGLPFSVVMFKHPSESGYSNIAIGTIVPAAELDIHLPHDYFNFCNQRLRFMRVFPLDERSFVIQMDLVLRNATREYVKFNFGLWGALFSQVLYGLIGRGRDSLVQAAEAYAATDVSQQYVSTVTAADTTAAVEASTVEEIAAGGDSLGPLPELVLEAEAEAPAEAAKPVTPEPVSEPAPVEPEGPFSEIPPADQKLEEAEVPSEHVMMTAEPAEGKDTPAAEIVADHPGEAEAVSVAQRDALLEPAVIEDAAAIKHDEKAILETITEGRH